MIAQDVSQKHGYSRLSQGRTEDSQEFNNSLNQWSSTASSLYRRRPIQFVVLAIVGISALAFTLVAITTGRAGGGFSQALSRPTTLPVAVEVAKPCPPPPAPKADPNDKVVEIDMERHLARMAKMHICFSLPSLLEFGGIETWFWMLYDFYFNVPPFKVHAVDVEGAFAPKVAARLTRGATRINIGPASQLLECDIIICTGT